MSFSIVFTKGADKDISESMQWYELQKKGLGKRFFDKLYEKVEKIEKNPHLYAIRYNNIRCASIDKFPFLIHYSLDNTNIVVLAILHTSRNPKIWEQLK